MSVTTILLTALVVGIVGLIVGFLLVSAGEKFKVEEDEKAIAIRAVLPGSNCGGCGYPGCDGMAAAISRGEAPVNGCPVGGDPVGKKVAAIMGEETNETEKMVAFVKCSGTCDVTKNKGTYYGMQDCRATMVSPGQGEKACSHGCKGLGTCVKACPFDAIHIVNGVAEVDESKCKACGKCVAVCPNHLIVLIPDSTTHMVKCNSTDKPAVVRQVCDAGCMGCGLCSKKCPQDAFIMHGSLAEIDPAKCNGCNICMDVCVKDIIIKRK